MDDKANLMVTALLGGTAFPESSLVEDRRGNPSPTGREIWEDVKRNNIIARWFRGGKYSGSNYEYLPRGQVEMNDPMAIALGADQIPVTTYGTTHPLKRYNPAYNTDLQK